MPDDNTRPKYDLDEAREILACSYARRVRGYVAERHKAFAELMRDFCIAAHEAGYATETSSGHRVCEVAQPPGIVTVQIDDDGVIWLAPGSRTDRLRGKEQPIQFNPLTGMFVGVDRDPLKDPLPGQQRPFRNAAAVIAESVARLLDAQTEAAR